MVRLVVACASLSVLLVGCGPSGPERVLVNGTVTYRGEAIGKGQICFMPCDGTKGPSVVENIIDGQYQVKTWGGLPAGTYRVSISAARELPPEERTRRIAAGASWRELGSQQYVPEQYNVQTQLKTTIEMGQNPLIRDFSLNN